MSPLSTESHKCHQTCLPVCFSRGCLSLNTSPLKRLRHWIPTWPAPVRWRFIIPIIFRNRLISQVYQILLRGIGWSGVSNNESWGQGMKRMPSSPTRRIHMGNSSAYKLSTRIVRIWVHSIYLSTYLRPNFNLLRSGSAPIPREYTVNTPRLAIWNQPLLPPLRLETS